MARYWESRNLRVFHKKGCNLRQSAAQEDPEDDRPPLPEMMVRKGKSADDRLTNHLMQAEYHLLAAAGVLSGQSRAFRRVGYQSRLLGAQEAITGLYREELVRERGPMRPGRRNRGR